MLISNFGSGPIVVTGASGWVGLTLVNQLEQLLPEKDFRSRVRAFSSRPRIIELLSGKPIQTLPFEELPALVDQEGCFGFLHAAFLTPQYCQKLGTRNYIQINRSITTTIASAVSICPSARVVGFSSGAAACVEENQALSSPAVQIYGSLKLEEERLLQSIASTLSLQIYALSGRFMPTSSLFALGNFLICAAQKKRIFIDSRNPVIRGYVGASDVIKCSLSWLFSFDEAQPSIAAVSEITTIQRLACLVSSLYGLQPPALIKPEGIPSSYSSSPIPFTSLCRHYEIQPMSLVDQVLDSASAFNLPPPVKTTTRMKTSS